MRGARLLRLARCEGERKRGHGPWCEMGKAVLVGMHESIDRWCEAGQWQETEVAPGAESMEEERGLQ